MKAKRKHQDCRKLVPIFAEYYRRNPAWGVLHVMFDDGNWDSAEFCLMWAQEQGDPDGIKVAKLALELSQTQRAKVARLARKYDNMRQIEEYLKAGREVPSWLLLNT